jgi:predicted metal-dependent enzyme (double-stranded beta helix superfamily)
MQVAPGAGWTLRDHRLRAYLGFIWGGELNPNLIFVYNDFGYHSHDINATALFGRPG